MAKATLRTILIFGFSLLLTGLLSKDLKAQERYKEWKENYLSEFEEFQNEFDKQFHEMLQKEWKEFKIKVSPDLYQEPKPTTIPRANKGNSQKSDSPDPSVEPKETAKASKEREDEPQEEGTPKAAEEKSIRRTNVIEYTPSGLENEISPDFKPEVTNANIGSNGLNYFGTPIRYKYYTAYETQLDRQVGKSAISDFWKHLSTKDYSSFLGQVKQLKSELLLNDYGYAQLLKKIGGQIYGIDTSEATLFTWFMLTQSGFGTRIAYNKDSVYLLVKTSPGVFHTTYFTINGAKYYGLSFNEAHLKLPNKLYTYEGHYPKSQEKELNLLLTNLPLLPQKTTIRTLEFTYNGSTHTFKIPVDEQIIDYIKSYPKANLELYFTSRMKGKTHIQLMRKLRPILSGKSDLEKTNILLRFVQEAFAYQTDQQQFNTEKKMFPAETLYYPASDCDDRSILFAHLLDNLTDLEYIVLRYPGHLTPAIHFPSDPPAGDRVGTPVTYNGKAYYVTDPTYVGADAGMVMTKYRNSQPEEIFEF